MKRLEDKGWHERWERLRRSVQDGGIRGGLRYLNSLTEHRYSALYRFEGEVSSALFFYDRENPDVASADAVPLSASYCVFVRDEARAVAIDDALSDAAERRERLAPGKPRETVRSYCGVPLLGMNGAVIGSICHFDLVPRPPVGVRHVELMQRLARML